MTQSSGDGGHGVATVVSLPRYWQGLADDLVSLPALIEVTLNAWDPHSHADFGDELRALADSDGGLRQRVDRWADEMRRLSTTADGETPDATPGGGPLYALLLCLLDPALALAAQKSGLLRRLIERIDQPLQAMLTPDGIRLLGRRAPLVALSVGQLEPVLTVAHRDGGSASLLALASHADVSVGRVGRWAAALGEGVYVGTAGVSQLIPDMAAPVALGWSAKRRLHVVAGRSAPAGLYRFGSAGTRVEEGWPPAIAGAVSPGAVVTITPDHRVLWGVTDGGGLVDLDCPADATRAICAGEWTAVISTDDQLRLHRGDGSWTAAGTIGATARTLLAADGEHVSVGRPDGVLLRLRWSDQSDRTEIPLFDGPFTHLAVGGEVTIAARSSSLVALVGSTVVGRWELDGEITAVGLSTDGACLAVSTPDRGLLFWRIDAAAELQLTSYTTDAADGADLLGIGPTVDALAALICARVVTPPLSVGLFGAWGSGKSFFMRSLQQRVEKITKEARDSRRPQQALWAWRTIRQVRFNAWHYAGADVWAGLLEQLLRELSSPHKARLELPAELDELQRRRLERLAGAQEDQNKARVT